MGETLTVPTPLAAGAVAAKPTPEKPTPPVKPSPSPAKAEPATPPQTETKLQPTDSGYPAFPKMEPMPKPEPNQDPFQAFGQPAFWLAAVGSLLTRRPLTTAIMSAGAAMQSLEQKNDKEFQRSMAEWKASTENSLNLMKYQQDAYKTAMAKRLTDARAGEAELKTHIAAFQDGALRYAYEHGGWEAVSNALHNRGQNAVTLEKQRVELEKLMTEKQVRNAVTTEVNNDPAWKDKTPEQRTLEIERRFHAVKAAPKAETPGAKAEADVEVVAAHDLKVSKGEPITPEEQAKYDEAKARQDARLGVKAATAGATTAAHAAATPAKPAPPAEADAVTVANEKIAAQEKELGRPLTDAEKAQVRIDTRTGVKAGAAGAVKAATVAATPPKALPPSEADAQAIAAVNLKKKNGEDITPEEQKAADAAQSRVDFRKELRASTAAATSAGRAPAPGSLAAERKARFDELKRMAEQDGTYNGDTAIWDKVDQQLVAIKENHISPEAAKLIVTQALAGDYSGLIGWGRSPGIRKDLEHALAEEVAIRHLTGADLARLKADYAAYTQGVKSFAAGGQMEKPTRALSVSVDHLDLLRETATLLAKHDVKGLNALQNALEREFGMKGPPTFDAIRNTVAAEIEKAVTGGAGAVADREELKASLNKNLAPEALDAVIAGYIGLMGGQLNGIRATYQRLQRIEGQTGDNFDKDFLTPRARKVLTGGGFHSADPSAAPTTTPEAGGSPAAAPPPKITPDDAGKAAYQALPSGAVFIAPDGQPHRKP